MRLPATSCIVTEPALDVRSRLPLLPVRSMRRRRGVAEVRRRTLHRMRAHALGEEHASWQGAARVAADAVGFG